MSKLLKIIFIIAGWSISTCAQETKSLHVKVVDQQSGAITKGVVKLINEKASVVVLKKIKSGGKVIFNNLKFKTTKIEIESPGFELFSKQLSLKEGVNSFTANLKIKRVEVKVEVEQSEIDKRLSSAFSGVLLREEINSLPNDPEKIEKELKRRYGEDLTIRVNGFTGGQIPPKELIRSIQISRGGFDAEFHKLGAPNMNIITKASVPKTTGMVMFNYGNSALNARNALAREKLPERNNSFLGFLTGPINRKSSFITSYNKFSNSREKNIIAKGLQRLEKSGEISKNQVRVFSGGINYDIGEDHTLRLSYQRSNNQITNAGVGGFNLPERGFSVGNLNNEIKASLIGTFAKKFTSQFRLRASFNKSENIANSQGVGITVSEAFNIGSSGVDNSSRANKFEAFEMLSTGVGKRFIKFGAEVRLESFNFSSSDGTNGSFFFNSLSSYAAGKPSVYSRTDRSTSVSFERKDLSLFVQDEYRITEKIQIGLGLHYEIQNHLSDKNNFSPRLSAALVFDENAKFVLRSGAGVLYRWHKANNIQHILKNDGGQSRQIVILNPGFPNPEDGGILRESLLPSIYRQADDLRNPHMLVAQTALNMNLDSGVKFDASYKFERGIHMFRSRDINAPLNGVRPNQKFGRIIQLESRGMFTRNSFEVSGQGVLFKRIGVNGRYRLSSAIDDFSGAFGLPMDNYNLRLERGRSNLDRRHFFTTRFNYSPFRDFRINSSLVISSPLPYTIITGSDDNGDSVFNDRPVGLARNTERGEWTKTVNLNVSWAIPIFKRSAKIIKNGKEEAETSLPKFLKYHKLNFSVNFNNLFNMSNKRGFVGNQLSPFFRLPTVAAPSRSITFNLMFLYF